MEIKSTECIEMLVVTDSIKSNLFTTARWANFLAILGYIGVGLLALIGIVSIIMGASFPGYMSEAGLMGTAPVWFGILYLIIAVVYFIMCVYLHRFSKSVRMAIVGNSQMLLEEGMMYQRKLYRFYGIVTIVSIGIAILAIILAGILAMP